MAFIARHLLKFTLLFILVTILFWLMGNFLLFDQLIYGKLKKPDS